jgi:TPR repeat protein
VLLNFFKSIWSYLVKFFDLIINFFCTHNAHTEKQKLTELADQLYESAVSLMKEENNENKNWPEIIELIKKAAALNNPRAQTALGLFYQEGFHVPYDILSAIFWYKSAADLGEIESFAHLSSLGLINMYKPEDPNVLMQWLTKGLELKNPYSILNLYQCFEFQLPTEKKKSKTEMMQFAEKVQKYFMDAYEGFLKKETDFYAQYWLGYFNQYGIGIPNNPAMALYWYQKAATQGHAKSQLQLYFLYMAGKIIPRNPVIAHQYLNNYFQIMCPEAIINRDIFILDDDEDFSNNPVIWIHPKFRINSFLYYTEVGTFLARSKFSEPIEDRLEKFLTKFADRDIDVMQYTLGLFIHFKKDATLQDLDASFQSILKAAEKGFADAQYLVGQYYEVGKSVPKNITIALQWYQKAAENNEPRAQNHLACLFLSGKSVSKDLSKGLNWLKKSAEQGFTDAQFNIGACYWHGEGIPKDLNTAFQWFLQSAERGHVPSQLMVAEIYSIDEVVPLDLTCSFEWYRKAAEDCNPYAQNAVGVLSLTDIADRENVAGAIKRFKNAVLNDQVCAQYNLGWCFLFGYGVPQNLKLAVRWLKKSAGQGFDHAQFILGELYFNGIGVKKNIRIAMTLYSKAAEQGHSQATKMLNHPRLLKLIHKTL